MMQAKATALSWRSGGLTVDQDNWMLRICLILVVALLCFNHAVAQTVELPAGFISSKMPVDLSPNGKPAYNANLEQASIFAWQQFVALNWPAADKQRGIPADTSLAEGGDKPKVWETMRARVEVYPGHGDPNGYAAEATDYGFDAAPDYLYAPGESGADKDGRIPACQQAGAAPWHNLDEKSQQRVMSGSAPESIYPGQNILIESKINRPAYVYVASRGWYGKNSIRLPARRTGKYLRTHLKPPRDASVADAPDDTEYISFPNDSMELKAAWRRLGKHDHKPRFQRSQVRYYRKRDEQFCYIDSDQPGGGDDDWGLLTFHITRKTPSAAYFIWATFEQVDSLVGDELDANGKTVSLENADGSIADADKWPAEPYSPNVSLVAGTNQSDQYYQPESMLPAADPKLGIYYYQEPVYDIPEVKYVAVKRRMYATPDKIAAVNKAAQQAIRQAAPDSPLQYYRLVAVQWKPLDKPPGVDYAGSESAAVYYAASAVIEAPPVHQSFSGQFTHGFSLASDYLHREMLFLNPQPNPGEPVFFNTYHGGKGYLSGGCMGCHGQRQSYGTDWSFLLFRQRVKEPDAPDVGL